MKSTFDLHYRRIMRADKHIVLEFWWRNVLQHMYHKSFDTFDGFWVIYTKVPTHSIMKLHLEHESSVEMWNSCHWWKSVHFLWWKGVLQSTECSKTPYNSVDGGTHKGCVAIIVFCSIAILMCLHVLFVAICKAKCL